MCPLKKSSRTYRYMQELRELPENGSPIPVDPNIHYSYSFVKLFVLFISPQRQHTISTKLPRQKSKSFFLHFLQYKNTHSTVRPRPSTRKTRTALTIKRPHIARLVRLALYSHRHYVCIHKRGNRVNFIFRSFFT
jgi:hypothetical protein